MGAEYFAGTYRALDFRIDDASSPLCDAPFRAGVILCLNCAEYLDDLCGTLDGWAGQQLVRQTQRGNIAGTRLRAVCKKIVLAHNSYALCGRAVLRAVVINATAQITMAAATAVRKDNRSLAIAHPRRTATMGLT